MSNDNGFTRDMLFKPQGIQNFPKSDRKILVVIAKPTRVCNAHCTYCSSPPLEEMGENWEPEWSVETFKKFFDKVFPYMENGAAWIWHGGEPMLMGADFYIQCDEHAKKRMKEYGKSMYFSMQSNMLGYNEKWKYVFENICGGSLSTSFDPDERNRTLKGNWKNYSRIFKKSLDKVLDDGFMPMVIGTYQESNAHMMHDVYSWSLSRGERSFPVRFNYCVPTGRQGDTGELISPITYGNMLVEVYNRWIKDNPNFTITPLDQMFKKAVGQDGVGHCPWTRHCGGRFMNIEPNGEVYNCSDFSDLSTEYCFGNLHTDSVEELLSSPAAINIRRRQNKLPTTCMTCEHFDDCEGGCSRDAALYGHGMYGKFHYCRSWKIVFSRIKESVIRGEADGILRRMRIDPEVAKNFVKSNLDNHFSDLEIDWDEFQRTGLKHPFGFAENNNQGKKIYGEYGEILTDLDKKESLFIKEKDKATRFNQKLSKIKIVVKD